MKRIYKGDLNARATVFLSSDMMRHRNFHSIPVYEKPARLVRAEIEVGVVRAHDVGVLLTPFRFPGDLDDDVPFVDLGNGIRWVGLGHVRTDRFPVNRVSG
jgi:hypothetical protein